MGRPGPISRPCLCVVLDGSELRKLHGEQMKGLMQVRDLDGKLVPSYGVLDDRGRGSQPIGVEGASNCDFCAIRGCCQYCRTRPGAVHTG